MIFHDTKPIPIYFLIFVCFVKSAFSRSKCDIFVNNKTFNEEKLYSTKMYEIKFGLPVKNKQSMPIGYSVDVECGFKNSTKLKATFTFDIQNTPIEINYISCDNALMVKGFNFTNKSEKSFLNFFIEFNYKNISKDIKMTLNLNRR